jgi:hypothetical protein
MNQCVFNCVQARAIDLVDYLASLGYLPAKIRSNNYWYASPFRDEKEPSFKVDRHLNLWYDHGWGKGGDIIEFGIQFYRLPIREVLKILENFGAHPGDPVVENSAAKGNRIEILQAKPIASTRLIDYLQKRRIPVDIADEFCREIHYSLSGKNYFAIGFPNRSGGYELRNEFFKGSASPKDISLIDRGANLMTVFEGFMDFLSYHAIYQNQSSPLTNFLVLNSLAYFEKTLPILDEYPAIHLYLDNDPAGKKHTAIALGRHSCYHDFSRLYERYKDLNDWIRYPGHLEKSGENQNARACPEAGSTKPTGP